MTSKSAPAVTSGNAKFAVLVAALGYFVDIYDLILFSVVRTPSLRTLNVPPEEIADKGQLLLNMQMIGMLVGGLLWGILGDRRGRLSVLFGSIITYSIANILNGFVTDVPTYAVLRFVAGVGLAGELGAGITLVTELLDRRTRGWATTMIAGVGICGAMLAVGVSKVASWQVSYWIGGGLGLLLLVLRVKVFESGLFHRTRESAVSRGNFFRLFATADRAKRYLSIILVAVPIWYAVGVLVSFCDFIGGTMGMTEVPEPANAVFFCYLGLAIGDFASGLLSQIIRSRKRALLVFCVANALSVAYYFTIGKSSLDAFYVGCLLLGIANGYWAVFVTVAAEQFGTNLRATAATTAPNFVRGSLVPVLLLYSFLRDELGGQGHGEPMAAIIVGTVVIGISFVSLLGLEETYGKDLDFNES